jgi:N-acetylglutamate synthase-like GNAT family acetyltransferase
VSLGIRRAVEDDAAAVARIYIESWNAGFGDLVGVRILDGQQIARWAKVLRSGPARWWVAELDGEVVGVVGVGPNRDPRQPGLGELDTIAVAPARWRTGTGSRLMLVALEALAEDHQEAIVWTFASYERGRRFYEATGWKADGGQRADGQEVSFRRRCRDA